MTGAPPRREGTARTRYAWVVMAGCCALMFGSLGTVGGTAAVFLVPVSRDLGVSITALSVYLSVYTLLMAALSPLAGRLLGKFKPGRVIGIASALLATGNALYGVCDAVGQFCAASVMVALGASVAYFVAVPAMVVMWFRERVAFAMSVALSFSGIGSMVMNIVIGAVIRSGGWRAGFFAVAATCAALTVPVAFLLFKTPEQKGLLPYGVPPTGSPRGAGPGAQPGVTQRQSFRTPAFYLMFAGQFCFSVMTVSYQLLSTYGQADLGFDPVRAGAIVSACALGLVVGKVALGAFTDRAGADRATVAGGAVTAAGLAMVALAFPRPGLVFLAGAVFGLGMGVYNVEPPVYVRQVFGLKEYSAVFGGVALATTLGSGLFVPIYNRVAAEAGDYRPTFYLSAAFTVLACGLYIAAGRAGRGCVERFDPHA